MPKGKLEKTFEADLIPKIYNDFVTKVSTINAYQKKYLNRIKNSSTNEELDTIEKEVIELTYTDIFDNNI